MHALAELLPREWRLPIKGLKLTLRIRWRVFLPPPDQRRLVCTVGRAQYLVAASMMAKPSQVGRPSTDRAGRPNVR